MAKKIYKIRIIGVTDFLYSEDYYVNVKVLRANFDIKTFKRSLSGFTIDDFPNVDIFNIIGDDNTEWDLSNQYSIFQDETYSVIEIDKTFYPTPPSVGDYLYLEKEIIKIHKDITPTGSTRWALQISRGFFGTQKKTYIVENSLKEIADEDDLTYFDGKFKVSTFKRSFNGFRVELIDPDTDIIEAVGVIKSVNLRGGRAIIVCDDLFSSIEVSYKKYLNNINETSDELLMMIPFEKNASSTFTPSTWNPLFRYPVRAVSDNYFPEFSILGHNQPEIRDYIDRDLYYQWCKLASFPINMIIDSDGSDDIKVIDFLNFQEFVTGAFWMFQNGSFFLLEYLKQYSTLNPKSHEMKGILNSLNIEETDVITKPIQIPSIIEVKYKDENGGDKSVEYISADSIGLRGSNISFSFDLNLDGVVDQILAMVQRYFDLLDFIVCELAVNIPYELSNNDYELGSRFEIADIEYIDTFQKKGQEKFTEAFVSKIEENNTSIMVGASTTFNPLSISILGVINDDGMIEVIPETLFGYLMKSDTELPLIEKTPYFFESIYEYINTTTNAMFSFSKYDKINGYTFLEVSKVNLIDIAVSLIPDFNAITTIQLQSDFIVEATLEEILSVGGTIRMDYLYLNDLDINLWQKEFLNFKTGIWR